MSYVASDDNAQLLAPYYPFIVEQCRKLFDRDNTIHLDLANDIYIKVCNIQTTKIKELIHEKKMEAYLYQSIKSERYGTVSRFHRLYKREPNYIEIPETGQTVMLENLAILTDFEKKMLALYVRWGTYDEAAKRSKINRKTIMKIIKDIATKLKT